MKCELLKRMCLEEDLRKEKEITFVQWILYLYLKSYWSL